MATAFDAPMMDFHSDGDVQMQPSHEMWFQDEAIMEDDGQQHGETLSSNAEFEDVEIEMEETYAEGVQNPEYEMIDEGADYPVSAVEEEDIIVADESHPTEVHADPATVFHASVEALTPTSAFASQELPFQEPSVASLDSNHVGGDVSGIVENAGIPSTEIPGHTIRTDLDTTQASAPEIIPADSAADGYGEHPIPSTNQEQTGVESADHLEHRKGEEAPHTTSQLEAPAADLASSQIQEEPAAGDDLNELSISGAPGQDGLSDGAPSQEYVGQEHVQYESVPPGAQSMTETPHGVAVEPAQFENAVAHHEAETTVTANDSHEVSDNVALEPAPGILLSFASAEQPEASLFSQPNYPESSSSANGHSYRVLFESNHMLYYEPLSTVFEHLRQDEFVAGTGDIAHSELVLDAHDLQLVISEDNIFSREISLYDLHQLHVGSDFSGPLRLRLQATPSRFIVRYRLLQEQIFRLDLAAQEYNEEDNEPRNHTEGHDSVEDQTAHHPATEGTEETFAEELTRAETRVEEGEAEQYEEGTVEGHEEHEENEEYEEQGEQGEHDGSETLASNETVEETENAGEQDPADVEQESRGQGVELASNVAAVPEEVEDNQPDSLEYTEEAENTQPANIAVSTNEEQITSEGHDDSVADADNLQHEGDDDEEHNDLPSEVPEVATEGENQPVLAGEPDETAEDPDADAEGDTDDSYGAPSLNGAEEGAENPSEHEDEESYEQSEYAEEWDDSYEDGGLDTTFEEPEGQGVVVGESHNTLSSRNSKRSIDEVDVEGADEEVLPQLDSPGAFCVSQTRLWKLTAFTGSKRPRTE
ncbi:hypothetical protein V5O48_014414 [Marasmius crinis-equi]|uniref:Uncharacterized protein n=1 Tax=Marasmius crinis-equi TaxID=585013 RepID=A0ABR3EXF6_9AGAR